MHDRTRVFVFPMIDDEARACREPQRVQTHKERVAEDTSFWLRAQGHPVEDGWALPFIPPSALPLLPDQRMRVRGSARAIDHLPGACKTVPNLTVCVGGAGARCFGLSRVKQPKI